MEDYRHTRGSPKGGNMNPLLIESMDGRLIEDMTARRRSQAASRLAIDPSPGLHTKNDPREKVDRTGIDRIISQELNVDIGRTGLGQNSSRQNSPGHSRNSRNNVRAISSLSTNKKADSPIRDSKFQAKPQMDRRNMMNKSSIFGD
jgi:hypothetical protein